MVILYYMLSHTGNLWCSEHGGRYNTTTTTTTVAHIDEDMNLTYVSASYGKTLSDIKERKIHNEALSPNESPIKTIQSDNTDFKTDWFAVDRKNLKGIVFSDSKVPTNFVGLRRPSQETKNNGKQTNGRQAVFKVKIVARHPTEQKWINGLCPYGEKSALYGDVNPDCLVKVNLIGDIVQETKKLEIKVTDIVAHASGDMFVSYEEGQTINKTRFWWNS